MTASPIELPQLPPKPWIWLLPSGNLTRIMRGEFAYPEEGTRLHAEPNVIAWGQQCYEAGVRAERERILALCAGQSEVYAGKMKDAQKLSMEERWERMYNYNDAVENIAAAIRKG